MFTPANVSASFMKNLSATQFLIYVSALTLGVALALPAVPWLRPLGIVLVVVASAVVRGEAHVRRHLGSLLTGIVLMMAAAFVGVNAPGLFSWSYRPSLWYSVTLGLAWAVGLFVGYRRWRAVCDAAEASPTR